ncbi:MAG: type II toxin-antitoxin system VapC family toxin [Chloroflexi bacterium]|nr:type II toxin-antitoxin system VapC family toxin [Chloroflexota bacterium]
MIVDTSAIIAILFGEADSDHYDRAIAAAPNCHMSVANFIEATIVLESREGIGAGHEFDAYLEESGIELVPVTVEQARAARRAWQRFGRGNHPAALNLGDCFAYALAEATGEPLLYKGEDFALTDIPAA